ncbi:MAG: hypothetical protein ACM3IJ_04195, partial [Candidatus Levyibacteriota bacterium]
ATASSQIFYGWGSSYDFSTTPADVDPMVTNHSVLLSGFSPCESFHYQVVSTDSAGFTLVSNDSSFTTSGCSVLGSITDISNTNIASASGGTVSLLNNGLGISLTIPASAASADANFQIKQIDKTSGLSAAPAPSGLSLVSNYFYELKAFADWLTPISTFSADLTLDLAYGSADTAAYTESSFGMYTWDGNVWSLLTCTYNTSLKKVSCPIPHFSGFALFGQAIPAQNSTPSQNTTTSCGSTPNGIPNIFQVDTTSSQATLYFSPVSSNLSYYYISYGYDPNNMLFGVSYSASPSTGVQSYTINYLNPLTKYYFKVRGGDGCVPGDWGNTFGATTKSLVSASASGSASLSNSTSNQASGAASQSDSQTTGQALRSQIASTDNGATVSARGTISPTGIFDGTVKIGLMGAVLTAVGLALLAL